LFLNKLVVYATLYTKGNKKEEVFKTPAIRMLLRSLSDPYTEFVGFKQKKE